MGAQGRQPKPTIINWDNASKPENCASLSISQDTAEHNRRELLAFCQKYFRFTDFQHNKGTWTIAALELMTKLKIVAHRQGCVVSESQEIAK